MYGKPEKCRINHYKVPLPVSFLCKEIAMKSGSGHVRFFFLCLHICYIFRFLHATVSLSNIIWPGQLRHSGENTLK